MLELHLPCERRAAISGEFEVGELTERLYNLPLQFIAPAKLIIDSDSEFVQVGGPLLGTKP